MASEMSARVGTRIRQRREEMGLKQGQLAALIGSDAVNNQRVSDWERGVHKPSERYMEQIARVLERDVSWFYAEDVEAGTPDLMGRLADPDATQLDRIEAKLDELLSQLPEEGLAEVLEGEADLLDELRGQIAALWKRIEDSGSGS